MKNSNLFRKAFFAAIALMMTSGIYSCKSKEAESTETDIDTVRTVEEVETMPADTATIADDTLAPTP